MLVQTNTNVFLTGLMPYMFKDPHFLEDPKLFDPFKKKY